MANNIPACASCLLKPYCFRFVGSIYVRVVFFSTVPEPCCSALTVTSPRVPACAKVVTCYSTDAGRWTTCLTRWMVCSGPAFDRDWLNKTPFVPVAGFFGCGHQRTTPASLRREYSEGTIHRCCSMVLISAPCFVLRDSFLWSCDIHDCIHILMHLSINTLEHAAGLFFSSCCERSEYHKCSTGVYQHDYYYARNLPFMSGPITFRLIVL